MDTKTQSRTRLPDYYEILGVDAKATLKEIKNVYRRHALNLHPDMTASPEDHDLFRRINDAYKVLSDPALRRKYDAMRLFGFGLPLSTLRQYVEDPAVVQSAMKKAGRFFATVSGMVRKTEKRRGRDLTVETTVTFAESYLGVSRSFHFGREVDCADCWGRGWSEVEPCKVCEGTGKISSDIVPIIGKRCPRCGAKGWVGVKACDNCEGKGRILLSHKVGVKVPEGVQHEGRLRVRGHGEGGHCGGEDGDLIVLISVEPDPLAKRNGNDLVRPVVVDFATAALGGTAEVRLPDGALTLRVPAGSWNGRRLRVAGRGFKDPVNQTAGDLFAMLVIKIPEDPDPEKKDLVTHYLSSVRGAEDAPAGVFKEELEKFFGGTDGKKN